MAKSHALEIFDILMEQVHAVEEVANQNETADEQVRAEPQSVSSILRRSAYVLAVAAFDTYFHELATEKLAITAKKNQNSAVRVASYVGNVKANELSGNQGEDLI